MLPLVLNGPGAFYFERRSYKENCHSMLSIHTNFGTNSHECAFYDYHNTLGKGMTTVTNNVKVFFDTGEVTGIPFFPDTGGHGVGEFYCVGNIVCSCCDFYSIFFAEV